jgi:lipopolysaccharide export LptBFGC system permease protein LptF
LLSLGLLILSDQVESEAQYAARRETKELALKHPMAYLEAGKVIKDFQDYIILTQQIDGNKLFGITIYQPQGPGESPRTIIAESGEVISSPDQKTLTIKLYDGSADEPNPDDPNMFYKLDFKTFELPPIYLGKENPRNKIEKKIKEMRFDELIYRLRNDPGLRNNPDARREYEAALHKKIAFSFAPLVFAMIALPAAVISRRGEAVISFSLAIGVVGIYYCLYVFGSSMVVQAHWNPFVAMWLPNLFMTICGTFLMKQAFSN